jgi:hypothetical protein
MMLPEAVCHNRAHISVVSDGVVRRYLGRYIFPAVASW